MGAVTYPNAEVCSYIAEHFVPVQYNVVEQPDAMRWFNSAWTPTILIQDADGREHRRTHGYLDPRRMVAELALGRLQAAIDRQDFQQATALSEEALSRCHGDPEREPEAQYWASVAAYKATNDTSKLLEGWNILLNRYPDSEWAHRAEFIRK